MANTLPEPPRRRQPGSDEAPSCPTPRAREIHAVEQGIRPAGPPRPRLPRALVLLAPPAPRAGAGGLPGGGDRRPRLRSLLRPATSPAYRMRAPRRRQRRRRARARRASTAAIAGHDWGSPIAANCALLRPDVFTAVALLSVPYTPRNGIAPDRRVRAWPAATRSSTSPTSRSRAARRREIEPDVRGWLGASVTSGDTSLPRPRTASRPGRAAARPLRPPPLPALAHRGRPRRLRGRVRAHRPHRRAQPLPQRRPRLGGPRRARRRAGPAAVALHRRRAGPLHDLARRRHRRARPHAPRPRLAAHPRRRRALSPAGGPGDREPAADRLAARRGPRRRLSPSALAGPFGADLACQA